MAHSTNDIPQATLHIYRPRKLVGAVYSSRIYLNDDMLLKIGNGGYNKVYIPAGAKAEFSIRNSSNRVKNFINEDIVADQEYFLMVDGEDDMLKFVNPVIAKTHLTQLGKW